MNEWLPIETAPTDGTWVLLLFKGNEDEVGMFDDFQVYDGYHSLRAWRTRDHVRGNPTHWLPLPKTPIEDGRDKI